jgi:hypothetical protein
LAVGDIHVIGHVPAAGEVQKDSVENGPTLEIGEQGGLADIGVARKYRHADEYIHVPEIDLFGGSRCNGQDVALVELLDLLAVHRHLVPD